MVSGVKKQTAGNYSSPAAEDIGETKICKSNKRSGIELIKPFGYKIIGNGSGFT